MAVLVCPRGMEWFVKIRLGVKYLMMQHRHLLLLLCSSPSQAVKREAMARRLMRTLSPVVQVALDLDLEAFLGLNLVPQLDLVVLSPVVLGPTRLSVNRLPARQ